MFGMLGKLAKATVGVVVETPVAVVADVFTLGGALNNRRKPYTTDALAKVLKNVQGSTK